MDDEVHIHRFFNVITSQMGISINQVYSMVQLKNKTNSSIKGQSISNQAVGPGRPLRFPRFFCQVILYQTYVEIPNIRHISALSLKLQTIDFFIDFSNSAE